MATVESRFRNRRPNTFFRSQKEDMSGKKRTYGHPFLFNADTVWIKPEFNPELPASDRNEPKFAQVCCRVVI